MLACDDSGPVCLQAQPRAPPWAIEECDGASLAELRHRHYGVRMHSRFTMSESGTRRHVHVVLHQEQSTPGRIGRLLKERGHALDVRKPRFGDPLPETLENHHAAVIFGGPMSANDNEDWLKREIDWIGVALAEKKPYLGL